MIRSVGLGRAGGLTGGSAVIGAAAAVATAGVTAPAGGQSLASGLRRDIHTIPRVVRHYLFPPHRARAVDGLLTLCWF